MEANKKIFSSSYQHAISAYVVASFAILVFGDFETIQLPKEILKQFSGSLLNLPTIHAKYLALQNANIEDKIWPPLMKLANTILLQFSIVLALMVYLFLSWKTVFPYQKSDFTLVELKQLKRMLYGCIFGLFVFPLMILLPDSFMMAAIKNNLTIEIPSASKIKLGIIFIGFFLSILIPTMPIFIKK